ncbi:MAG: alpha/beta hydrolase [Flammeovirgaceae bacterium]
MSELTYEEKYLPKIEVIGNEFEIPLLGKKRRISVLLPHNYDETDFRYPVLYLQDGQNTHDDYGPFGNWAVNKRMAKLFPEGFGNIIIVAIDHAEEYRIKEFTPYDHPKFGEGEGDDYVKFVTKKLKPEIDERYRTLPDRENTAIGGSSLGGLISLYAGLTRPMIYSKMLIFSPALWIAPPIYKLAKTFQPEQETRVYLYTGGNESEFLVPNMKRMKHDLKGEHGGKKNLDVRLSIREGGTHSEHFWGEEFPAALKWLFFKAKYEREVMS